MLKNLQGMYYHLGLHIHYIIIITSYVIAQSNKLIVFHYRAHMNHFSKFGDSHLKNF